MYSYTFGYRAPSGGWKLSWKLGASLYTPSLYYPLYSMLHRKLLLQNRLQTPRWLGSKFTYKKLEASESETLRISALVSSSLRYSYHYRGLTIQVGLLFKSTGAMILGHTFVWLRGILDFVDFSLEMMSRNEISELMPLVCFGLNSRQKRIFLIFYWFSQA